MQHLAVQHPGLHCCFPLSVHCGLARLQLRPFTDEEFDTLPHVILTSDTPWDPSILDSNWSLDDGAWSTDLSPQIGQQSFDEIGNYLHRYVTHFDHDNALFFFDADEFDHWDHIDNVMDSIEPDPLPTWATRITKLADFDSHSLGDSRQAYHSDRMPSIPEFELFCPLFAWLPVDTIKQTFESTTQLVRMPAGEVLKQFFKFPFPAFNIPCCNEDVGTNPVFVSVLAIDDGSTMA